MNTFKNNLHGRYTFNVLIVALIYSCAFGRSISSALPSPVSAAVSTQHKTQTNSNTVNITALMAANQSNIVIVKDLAALHRMFPSIASNNTSSLPQLPPHRARGLRAATTCIKTWNITEDDYRNPKVVWSAVCSSQSPCAVECVPVRARKEVSTLTLMGYRNGYQFWQWKSQVLHYIKDCRCQS